MLIIDVAGLRADATDRMVAATVRALDEAKARG
jgi:hypothetical protein